MTSTASAAPHFMRWPQGREGPFISLSTWRSSSRRQLSASLPLPCRPGASRGLRCCGTDSLNRRKSPLCATWISGRQNRANRGFRSRGHLRMSRPPCPGGGASGRAASDCCQRSCSVTAELFGTHSRNATELVSLEVELHSLAVEGQHTEHAIDVRRRIRPAPDRAPRLAGSLSQTRAPNRPVAGRAAAGARRPTHIARSCRLSRAHPTRAAGDPRLEQHQIAAPRVDQQPNLLSSHWSSAPSETATLAREERLTPLDCPARISARTSDNRC